MKVAVNVVLGKRKGKAATYRDCRYRQLQNTESGGNHRASRSRSIGGQSTPIDRSGTISLVARGIDRRAGYGQLPDVEGPSETWPGFTITHRPSGPWPPPAPGSASDHPPHEPRRALTPSQGAPGGAHDRRRRPRAGPRVSPADPAVLRAGTRPCRWRCEPRGGRRVQEREPSQSQKSPRRWSDAGWLRGQTTRRRIHRRSDGGPERRRWCPDGGPEHRYECYTETPPYVSRPNYEPISGQCG